VILSTPQISGATSHFGEDFLSPAPAHPEEAL
jgi:hypothetical protein